MRTRHWFALAVSVVGGLAAFGAGGCSAPPPEGLGTVESHIILDPRATRVNGYNPGDGIPDNTLYLTFDDGPGPFTGEVLDILKKERVPATFFMCGHVNSTRDTGLSTGDRRGYYRTVLTRMIAEGHVLGNHTDTHADLGELTLAAATDELDRAELEIDRALGFHQQITLARPPFGSPWTLPIPAQHFRLPGSATTMAGLLRPRVLNILWDVYGGDSDDMVQGEAFEPSTDPNVYDPNTDAFRKKVKRVTDAILGQLHGQSAVVLMHDARPTLRDALPGIIAGMKSRRYQFGTIEDLVRYESRRSSAELVRDQ